MSTEANSTPIAELKNVKLTRDHIERFWNKVNKNGQVSPYCKELGPCWEWTAGCFQSGYGQFSVDHIPLRAHRIAFYLGNGYLPAKPLIVTHLCHNQKCCNYSHLKPGTPQSNMDDKVAAGRECKGLKMSLALKGKTPKGENSGMALLTNEQALEIRRRFTRGGVTKAQIARDFSVSHAVISHIIFRRSWTHLP